MRVDMGFEYTVLPDGTIFKLECPEDFIEARQIIHDETADILSDEGWQGPITHIHIEPVAYV